MPRRTWSSRNKNAKNGMKSRNTFGQRSKPKSVQDIINRTSSNSINNVNMHRGSGRNPKSVNDIINRISHRSPIENQLTAELAEKLFK